MNGSDSPTQQGQQPNQSQFVSPLALYNIYAGINSGNPVGEARAGLGAANIYGKLNGDPNISAGAGAGLNALGIYSGLQQGGWQGDTSAAANAAQLAGNLTGDSTLSAIGSGAMVPLALYNEIQNYQSGNTTSDAMAGAQTGGAIGSFFGPIGTGVGALAGGALGALASAFGPGEKDPETYLSQDIINATSANKNSPYVAASVPNPYLALAGMMDERSSTLPEYAQYGRMGEQHFATDLAGKINQAVAADPSLANNPNAIYNQDIAPWVNSMGSGYKNVGPEYTATNEGLIGDMVNQYMSGRAALDWKSVGGQSPFSDIYNNSPGAIQSRYQGAMNEQQDVENQIKQESSQANYGLQAPRYAAAQGGHMAKKTSKPTSVLDQIRPSFQDVPHFDDGGSVGYNSSSLYFNPATYGGSAYDFNLSDPTQASNSPIPDYSTPSTDQMGLNSINYGSSDSGSSGSGLGGILGSLGLGSLGSAIKNYGALAPIIAAALGGGNKPASAPSTPKGFTSGTTSATLPAVNYNRTYTQPNVSNWYTYGQGPEQSFYSNNQIPQVAGVTPTNTGTAAGPSGPGRANIQPIAPLRPSMMAHGGMFNSPAGDDYVPDPGHGDGTSDDIDAKLSGGEYVMDAGTVSMLGNGSNEAGARALDQLRERVRKHAGKHLVKGKQFMKAKAPDSYLKGGQ